MKGQLAPDDADAEELIVDFASRVKTDQRTALRYVALGEYVSNPHNLVAWTGLTRTLEYLRSQYDLVLIDTAPVLTVSDTLNVSEVADGVLMMIDWRHTPRQSVIQAVDALRRSSIKVTGAIMTKVDLRQYARSGGGGAPLSPSLPPLSTLSNQFVKLLTLCG